MEVICLVSFVWCLSYFKDWWYQDLFSGAVLRRLTDAVLRRLTNAVSPYALEANYSQVFPVCALEDMFAMKKSQAMTFDFI